MLGIDYVSSDEEETAPVAQLELAKQPITAKAPVLEPAPAPVPLEETSATEGPPEGPAQGPSATPPPAQDEVAESVLPGSPYTSSRLMIQNLTLPTVPNLNIPPSPPGSPPPRSTKKFAQFLELKKKGQHFNQRLESSSVVRDPNHSRKLMEFAGITEEDQYVSTLSEGLGVPVAWPEWAYGDALNASQKKINKAREDERSKVPRQSVDFVPARSLASSRTGTPSGKRSQQSAAERVITGASNKRLKDR